MYNNFTMIHDFDDSLILTPCHYTNILLHNNIAKWTTQRCMLQLSANNNELITTLPPTSAILEYVSEIDFDTIYSWHMICVLE